MIAMSRLTRIMIINTPYAAISSTLSAGVTKVPSLSIVCKRGVGGHGDFRLGACASTGVQTNAARIIGKRAMNV